MTHVTGEIIAFQVVISGECIEESSKVQVRRERKWVSTGHHKRFLDSTSSRYRPDMDLCDPDTCIFQKVAM